MKTRQLPCPAQRPGHRRGMASVFVIAVLALVAMLLMSSGRMVRQMKEEVDLAERLQLRRLNAIATPAARSSPALPAEAEGEVPADGPEDGGRQP